MAQSGYTPILIYASGTASNVPLAANLTSSASGAELALNYADGKLYFKNSSGVVTLLAGVNGTGIVAGSNTQIQFNNSGVFGASANLTWSGTVLSTTGLTATGAITLNTTTNNQSYTTTGAGTITISSGTAGSINNMNIGATTAGTGTFTTLSASSTVSGTGFSTYLASPPAIGGTAANTGAFTSITSTSASGILTRAAATQDGVELIGRAGGTTSLKVTFTPTTLTASRTLTLPDNSGTLLTTGAVVTVAQGGTGQTTYTDGQLLIGNTTGNTLTKATLTAGTGVTITNGAGAITINATGTGGSVTSVAQSFTGGLISVAGSPITTSGTLALTVAGTSGGVPYFSSASTWASSAALAANALMIGGGAGFAPATTTTGTGVLTALGTAVGTAGAFVVNGGALGTPSSGTVTNLTGTASININGTVGATTPAAGTFTSVTNSGLTTGRVVYTTTGGLETASAGLTFDGTNFATTGTATAAKLIPTGSSAIGNGLYLPAVNALGLSTNGINAVYIDASQNVGIGTSSPGYKLQVSGAIYQDNGYAQFGNYNAGGANSPVAGGISFSTNITSGQAEADVWNGNDPATYVNTGILFTQRLTSTTRRDLVFMHNNGNVGIGTNSPGALLDIAAASVGVNTRLGPIATMPASQTACYVGSSINSVTGTGTNGDLLLIPRSSSTGNIVFATGNGTPAVRAVIDSSGNVGIGTSAPGYKLDVQGGTGSFAGSSGVGAIRVAGAGGTWFWIDNPTTTTMRFSSGTTAGTGAVTLDSSGNVGIGTSSPGYKLDVANSDAQVYGVRVGRGAGAISTNTVLGSGVLPSNSTGSSNTAIGYRAGNPITTGTNNTFLGPDTGYGLQSSASYNTVLGAYALNASASVGPTGAVAVGYSAGYYLKNADYSVVIGYQAGAYGGFYQTNSTVAIGYQASQYNYGSQNTAIGYQANYGNAVNSNSLYITAVGHSALFSNTASYNTAFGTVAGYSNTSGTNNTFIGASAAYSGTTGSNNIALGPSSLYNNQTNSNITSVGSQAQYYMRADGNTSIGYQSLYGSATPASNTGGYNTVIGYQAVFNTFTTGAYNTVIGASAGYSLTTGSQNVLIGSSSTASTAAGYAITTGQYNVVIGPYTGNSGGLDIRTASNFVVFADGQSNIRQVFNSSGVSLTAQGAPASITTTATLTGAQVLGGLINTTGTTYTVTMPLGTSLDTALVGCPTDFAFNFSVINTASGTITMAVNTGITSLGSLSISTGTSATYRVRKTAANTFVMYRI